MGLFKILGFAALGVGAVAAAPFTGGGSILGAASLAGSLAGAGITATAAGAAGAAVGAVSTALDSDETIQEANRVRKEGYEMGFKEGEVKSKKKFMESLKKDDNLRLGVFALSLHVAKLDGLDDSEMEYIEKEIGRPDGTANAKLRDRFQSIWENDMSFPEIKERFLNEYSVETLTELDDLIRELIKSDNVISDKEQDFVDNVWAPYLKERLN